MGFIKKLYVRLGQRYFRKKKIELAAKYYLKGESEATAIWQKLEIAEILHNLDRPEEALQRIGAVIEQTNDISAYERRAHILREMGRKEEALLDLDEVIKREPDSYLPWYTRGITYRDLARYDEAVRDLHESIKREDEDTVVTTYYELAMVYYESGKFNEAVDAFRQTLSYAGKDIPVYYLGMARALDAAGEVDEAIRYLLQGIEMADVFESRPDHGLSLLIQKTNYSYGAFQTFRRQIQNTYSFRMDLSDLYAQKREYDLAADAISQALRLYPGVAELYLKRGIFHRLSDNWNEAEQDLNRALEADPDLPKAYYEKALLYRQQEQEERSLQVLLELNGKFAESPVACYWLADSYYRLERYEEALPVNQRLLELEDDDPLNYVQQGEIYHALGRESQAVASYTRALELAADAEVFMKRSYLYYKLDKYDEAWVDLQEAAAADAELPETAYYQKAMGYVLKAMERWDFAAEAFTNAIELNPDDPALYEGRAECHLELNELDQAAEDCTAGLKADPSYSILYSLRGYIHYLSDRYEEAKSDAEDFIRMHPDSIGGYYNLGLIYYSMAEEDLALKMFNRVLSIDSFHARTYLYKAYIHFNRIEFEACIDCLVQWGLYLDAALPLERKLEQLRELNGLDEDVIETASVRLSEMYSQTGRYLN